MTSFNGIFFSTLFFIFVHLSTSRSSKCASAFYLSFKWAASSHLGTLEIILLRLGFRSYALIVPNGASVPEPPYPGTPYFIRSSQSHTTFSGSNAEWRNFVCAASIQAATMFFWNEFCITKCWTNKLLTESTPILLLIDMTIAVFTVTKLSHF